MDEPTSAARWRRTAVQPVLDAYAACAAVDAVMLSGSTARGDADRWSADPIQPVSTPSRG